MVTDPEDQEPPGGAQAAVSPRETTKRANALSNLSRNLTEDELRGTGTQKLLLNEVDRLENEVARLTEFSERYHSNNTELAVAREKTRWLEGRAVLVSACFTLSGVLMGLVPGLRDQTAYAAIIGVVGAALLIGAIAAQWWRR